MTAHRSRQRHPGADDVFESSSKRLMARLMWARFISSVITPSKLAVDCEIEHGEVANAAFNLELRPDRPDVFWSQRRLCPGQLALVPRQPFMRCRRSIHLIQHGHTPLLQRARASAVGEAWWIRPICSFAEVVYLEPAEKLAHKTIFEGFMAVVRSKNASPTWNDVKTALLDFDRAGLRGLVQVLYTASKDNQAFLHARLGLGHDQLQPFKASISRWCSSTSGFDP
jgi:hypothetical protein